MKLCTIFERTKSHMIRKSVYQLKHNTGFHKLHVVERDDESVRVFLTNEAGVNIHLSEVMFNINDGGSDGGALYLTQTIEYAINRNRSVLNAIKDATKINDWIELKVGMQ